MAVGVEFGLAVATLLVNVIAGVGLAAVLAGGEEDRIVIEFRAKWSGAFVVLPFLEEQDAGLGPGMRLEGVAVKADDGEDAGLVGDELSDVGVGGVVEAPLRQDDTHSPAGFEEFEVALDK